MNSIKGTPIHWKKFKTVELAMLKQISVPTFFLTSSSAGPRWNEWLGIIQKLDKADCNISDLSYHNRYSILNSNSVMVGSHFQ